MRRLRHAKEIADIHEIENARSCPWRVTPLLNAEESMLDHVSRNDPHRDKNPRLVEQVTQQCEGSQDDEQKQFVNE